MRLDAYRFDVFAIIANSKADKKWRVPNVGLVRVFRFTCKLYAYLIGIFASHTVHGVHKPHRHWRQQMNRFVSRHVTADSCSINKWQQ